ncbi:hypothetical protein [Anaerotignum propionicum]|uniref:hypothetical protein n=1 Tax=Anaerotignum propionicum TaxID=28446 RepID=UPI00138EC9B3|nr:hypothetical protein [Anaerotignum propionicum]
MSFTERTMTEPYTPRGVRTVPGEGGADLPPKCGKAALPYSTKKRRLEADMIWI